VPGKEKTSPKAQIKRYRGAHHNMIWLTFIIPDGKKLSKKQITEMKHDCNNK
jgi:hypothetical protein